MCLVPPFPPPTLLPLMADDDDAARAAAAKARVKGIYESFKRGDSQAILDQWSDKAKVTSTLGGVAYSGRGKDGIKGLLDTVAPYVDPAGFKVGAGSWERGAGSGTWEWGWSGGGSDGVGSASSSGSEVGAG